MSSGFIIYYSKTAAKRVRNEVFHLAYLEGYQLESNIPDFFNHSSREMLLWRQKYHNRDKARSLYEILYNLHGVAHEHLLR